MDGIMALPEVLAAWGGKASTPQLIGAGVLAALGTYLLLHFITTSILGFRVRHLPGPPAWPIAGHIPYLLKEPWIRFAQFAAKYGGVYKMWVWDKLFVVVSDPKLIQEVFTDKRDIYPKDDWSYAVMKDVLGRGLVTVEGTEWLEHKRLLSPAFHFQALERLHSVFTGAADRLVAQLEATAAGRSAAEGAQGALTTGSVGRVLTALPAEQGRGAVLELSGAFRAVTLEVICQVALGLGPSEAGVFPSLFEAVLDELNTRLFAPWRALPFWPGNAAYRARLGRLNGIVYGTIAARREARRARLEREGNAAGGAAAAAGATGDAAASGNDAGGGGLSLAGTPIYAPFTDPDTGVRRCADILDMILDAQHAMAPGTPLLSDEQIADEVKTQLLAGHETSSLMLTWATYLLAAHPAALAKAQAEVDTALGLLPGVRETPLARTDPSRIRTVPDGSPELTFESYRGLSFLECCLKEAMRLYSPVPVLTREAAADDMLGGPRLDGKGRAHADGGGSVGKGAFVPRGARIMVSIWALHTDPAIWGPDVGAFRPERHMREEARTRHAYSYLPFSANPRVCIGQNLAITEGKVVLASLLRKFALRLAPGTHTAAQGPVPTDSYVIPVRPRDALRVIFEPRA